MPNTSLSSGTKANQVKWFQVTGSWCNIGNPSFIDRGIFFVVFFLFDVCGVVDLALNQSQTLQTNI